MNASINDRLEAIKPLIREWAAEFGIDPMVMMAVVARAQRDLGIPVLNDPAGNKASVRWVEVPRLGRAVYNFIDKHGEDSPLAALADTDLRANV